MLFLAARLLPTQCGFAFSVGTYDGQLALLSTYGFRSNATPYGPSSTNAVWFRVFRWHARQTTSSPIHVRLLFKRIVRRHVQYQHRASSTRLLAINSILDAWYLPPQCHIRFNTRHYVRCMYKIEQSFYAKCNILSRA
jgi:hypothetical protein